MANRNGLGPNNEGPMSGRGLGLCVDRDKMKDAVEFVAGFKARQGNGRGMGFGIKRGRGRGFGRRRTNA